MSLTLWQRLTQGGWRLQQRTDWAEFLEKDWVERIMRVSVTDRFHRKQGRSTGRWILEVANRRLAVYLKRHYELPWWRGWLAVLWPRGGWSPAMQEWRQLNWAKGQGMPVPVALAAGEHIGPWGRLQSFLAIEELTDMLPLHEAIPAAAANLPPALFREWKSGLIGEVARLTKELHERRYFHQDLYLCHFYIPRSLTLIRSSWRGRVHLIDLHRLGRRKIAWRIWQMKDLAQLLYSSEITGIDDRDRLGFWRSYAGPLRGQLRTRLLRRCTIIKARRYRHHNSKKR